MAGDDNTDSGGPPLGFVKTGWVGLASAILGRAERKQRREPAGPISCELGHAQERVKGGWAGLATV
jgi:hypothetical protein